MMKNTKSLSGPKYEGNISNFAHFYHSRKIQLFWKENEYPQGKESIISDFKGCHFGDHLAELFEEEWIDENDIKLLIPNPWSFIWVSFLEKIENDLEKINADELRDKLGLGFSSYSPGNYLIGISIKNEENSKCFNIPTIIDAGGFNPYFRPSAKGSKYGKTINLKTGYEAYPELVKNINEECALKINKIIFFKRINLNPVVDYLKEIADDFAYLS